MKSPQWTDADYSRAEATITSILGVLATLVSAVLLWIVLAGCPQPWDVRAHASINTAAHAVAVGDSVLARQIARDPNLHSPDEADARYRVGVQSVRVARESLVTSERSVDLARSLQTAAARCRASIEMALSLEAVRHVVALLAAFGVIAPEIGLAADGLAVQTSELAHECVRADGG